MTGVQTCALPISSTFNLIFVAQFEPLLENLFVKKFYLLFCLLGCRRAYDPFTYSSEVKLFEGGNFVTAQNYGTAPTAALVDINFESASSFAQVTNTSTGETVLVGQMGSIEQSKVEKNPSALTDECKVLTN